MKVNSVFKMVALTLSLYLYYCFTFRLFLPDDPGDFMDRLAAGQALTFSLLVVVGVLILTGIFSIIVSGRRGLSLLGLCVYGVLVVLLLYYWGSKCVICRLLL